MALKDTIKQIRDLTSNIQADLDKSERGNKAASQRVRTNSVKLEKVAKRYRKESIVSEKSNKGKRPAKKAAKAKAKPAKKPAAKAKHKAVKGKSRFHASGRALSVRRPSAKLPVRQVRWS